MLMSKEFYRVVEDDPGQGCERCGHGKMFTIASGEGEEEISIGQSWGDEDFTGDICDLMNTAYEAGREAETINAEEEKLVEFFRSPAGDSIGRDGDYDNLTPAETAIRFMKKHR